jgi:hypothetical protein
MDKQRLVIVFSTRLCTHPAHVIPREELQAMAEEEGEEKEMRKEDQLT